MAIVRLTNGILEGLSSDTKPTTYPNGTIFFESNTGNIFMYISAAWTNISSATGEANTASNLGAGQGVFKSKVALDLQFRSLTATSSKIALANNTNDVGIDVTEANLTHDNIGGTLGVAKGGTGATTLTGILKGSGTSAITAAALLAVADGGTGIGTLTGLVKGNGTSAMSAVTAPTGAVVGDTDTQTETNKTMDAKSNTFTSMPTHPSKKRTGSFMGGPSPIATGGGCSGLLEGAGTAIAVSGGAYSQSLRTPSSGGLRTVYATGNTINAITGTRFTSANQIFERDQNPLIECKLACRTATTTVRVVFGLISSSAAPASLASPLDNLSGVLFMYDSAVDGNWHIHQNDGSVTADITTIANVAAADTSPHTFAIKAVESGTKFQYSYAGGAWTDINTKIPIATTGLGIIWYVECLAASAARALDLFWAWEECDP